MYCARRKTCYPLKWGWRYYTVVKDQKIAQAELTGSWEKRLEEIRSGASVVDFQEEIKTYTRTITNELLVSGRGLSLSI
jgi:DNA topoisomerase-3